MSLYASQKANDYGEFIVKKMSESINKFPVGSENAYLARNALLNTQSKYPYENLGEGVVQRDNATMAADLIEQFYPGVLGVSVNRFKRLSSFEKVNLLHEFAESLELDYLIEVHNEDELKRVEQFENAIIGVNNRNLRTFEINLNNSIDLKSIFFGKNLFVAESGIKNQSDIDLLKEHDIHVFLIGESLMKGDFV